MGHFPEQWRLWVNVKLLCLFFFAATVLHESAGAGLTSLLFSWTWYRLFQATGLVFVALSHFPLPIKSDQLWESYWVGMGWEGVTHKEKLAVNAASKWTSPGYKTLVRLWCMKSHILCVLPFILALLCMPTWFWEMSTYITSVIQSPSGFTEAAPDFCATINTETICLESKRRNKDQHWLTNYQLSPNPSIEMIDLKTINFSSIKEG